MRLYCYFFLEYPSMFSSNHSDVNERTIWTSDTAPMKGFGFFFAERYK